MILIAIMDYTLFPEHRSFFTRYVLQDDEGYRFSDKLQFYVMDLKAIDEAEEDKKENGWLMCPPGAEPRSLRHSAVSSWPRLGRC